MRRAVVVGLLVALASPAAAAPTTELDRASVIYQRGTTLYRSDAKGKGEVALVQLAPTQVARVLRTDARGSILLADLGGTWWWMALDVQPAALAQLPCVEGPAQLAEDGAFVTCRAKTGGSILVSLSAKPTILELPAGARVAGSGASRTIVWADPTAVWSAPLTDLKKRTKLAPAAPLRDFLPSPDGTRAVGVYADFIHEGRKKTPAEMLVGFALDGQAAHRKGLPSAVPLEWSHDGQYILMQDGTSACLVRALGGQYKCWKGFTPVSIAPDGSFALVLGARDGKSGELSLYRAKLAGPYDDKPVLVTKQIDGTAATWVPAKP